MNHSLLIGAYLPGNSPLHRLRPGAKLLGLIIFTLAITIPKMWQISLIALGVAVLLAISAGIRASSLWRITRSFALIGAPLLIYHAWAHGWGQASQVVAGLLAIILAASAVTASTKTADMIETLLWLLTPLRPLGVNPERVSFALSLAIRALPEAQERARETLDAARARGLERSMRARLVPFVIRAIAHARLTGEALAARGYGDEDRGA